MPDNDETPAAEPDLFEELARVRRAGELAALATVIGTRGSTPGKETMRLLVLASGKIVGSVGGGCVEADVVDAALEVMETEEPRRMTFRLTESATGETGLMCGGELEVFIEPVTAPQAVIFGAGHISRDLCTIASKAGFRVTVVDDREAFANRERFPEAARVVAGEDFDACFRQLEIPATAYCVVVTRGHAMDLACVDHSLHTAAAYVGLIGSKVKVRNILRRLGGAGRLEGVDMARFHSPVGVDLGGATHGEIAVSIVAELIAHRRRHLVGLRTKRLPLEDMRALAASRSHEAAPPEEAPESSEASSRTSGANGDR